MRKWRRMELMLKVHLYWGERVSENSLWSLHINTYIIGKLCIHSKWCRFRSDMNEYERTLRFLSCVFTLCNHKYQRNFSPSLQYNSILTKNCYFFPVKWTMSAWTSFLVTTISLDGEWVRQTLKATNFFPKIPVIGYKIYCQISHDVYFWILELNLFPPKF